MEFFSGFLISDGFVCDNYNFISRVRVPSFHQRLPNVGTQRNHTSAHGAVLCPGWVEWRTRKRWPVFPLPRSKQVDSKFLDKIRSVRASYQKKRRQEVSDCASWYVWVGASLRRPLHYLIFAYIMLNSRWYYGCCNFPRVTELDRPHARKLAGPGSPKLWEFWIDPN